MRKNNFWLRHSIFDRQRKSVRIRLFWSKHYWRSPLHSSWFDTFLCKHFVNHSFSKLYSIRPRPVGCSVYRLGNFTRKLKGVLCNIHLSKVAVSHGLKPANHFQDLIAICNVVIRQLDRALPIELKIVVIFCFHIFVACHLSVSVYPRFSVHRTYCFRTVVPVVQPLLQ